MIRRALKGGSATNTNGESYNVGPALTDKVDTFVGIAGGNSGIYTCAGHDEIKVCNSVDGYWPAAPYEGQGPSEYLKSLNEDPTREANHVFALVSTEDKTITKQDVPFGIETGRFSTVDDFHLFTTRQFSHLCLRDLTGPLLLHLFKNHSFDLFNFDTLFTSGLTCDFIYDLISL